MFTGTLSGGGAQQFERMTYTRIDDTHSTRSFELGPTAANARTISDESCTRGKAMAVPTPVPTLAPTR